MPPWSSVVSRTLGDCCPVAVGPVFGVGSFARSWRRRADRVATKAGFISRHWPAYQSAHCWEKRSEMRRSGENSGDIFISSAPTPSFLPSVLPSLLIILCPHRSRSRSIGELAESTVVYTASRVMREVPFTFTWRISAIMGRSLTTRSVGADAGSGVYFCFSSACVCVFVCSPANF